MIPVLSVENMRGSDAATIAGGIPGKELMRRAAEGIFAAADWVPPVAVVCGSGNNAGDGYALALLLQKNGIDCAVFLLSDKFSADGRYYYEGCLAAGVPCLPCPDAPDFSAYRTVADCIFGTGFSGEPRGKAKAAIEAINRSGAYVVSADINSGLDGHNGMAKTAVRSDLTVSVGSYQPGHFLNMAKDLMRGKTNVEIGIAPIQPPYEVLEAADAARAFPERKHFSNKSTYGYVGLVGGSARYIGAVKLAAMANAAMRGGAGVVKLAAPATLCASLRAEVLESTLYPLSDNAGDLVYNEAEIDDFCRGLKAIAFGMGIGRTNETAAALRRLLQTYTGTLIVDADGLNALAGMEKELIGNSPAKVILTPHNMEFSRLSGRGIDEILADPIPLAMAYAAETGATVLLKGPATVVTDGERVYIADRGTPGMATAGSGDVLSGLLAAVCGFCGDPVLAAAAAAWVNGRAGELAAEETGVTGMTAGDTARQIALAIKELT